VYSPVQSGHLTQNKRDILFATLEMYTYVAFQNISDMITCYTKNNNKMNVSVVCISVNGFFFFLIQSSSLSIHTSHCEV